VSLLLGNGGWGKKKYIRQDIAACARAFFPLSLPFKSHSKCAF